MRGLRENWSVKPERAPVEEDVDAGQVENVSGREP